MLDDSMAYHLTLSLDGWSNSRMKSIYSWNIVFPDRRVMLLRSDDLSSMSHTGINLAELVIKEVKKWGADRFAGIVTDNAANMVAMRRNLLHAFKHMVEFRCMMHAFNTCMGSLLGHAWAKKIVKRNQKMVTSVRASHLPLTELGMIANRMGITRMLITSNKTRFTSVHASMESVVRLQPALTELADKQPYLLTDKALALITDDMFFIKLKKLCYLLEPFTLVIHAVQSNDTTAADVMRYWLLLAKHISKLPSDSVDADFKAHCFTAYNLRHNEMVSPLCQLALLLHPLYRPAVITGRMHWDELRETAGQLWQSRRHSKAECRQLMQVDLEQYKLGDAPYNRLPLNGQLATLRLWWRGILHDNPELQLPSLALLLLDIKPHAVDPEKTFSLIGWFQSDRRSRMLNRTTTNLTMIKMHLMTSMVLGDGVLTPAQSVLGAIYGLQVKTSVSQGAIVGISCAIVVGLFMVQRFGTGQVGFVFAPIILIYFLCNVIIAVTNITRYKPSVFKALSPHYGYYYFRNNHHLGWVQCSGLFLAITGTEAAYADLGHFSRPAIRISFLAICYPVLILTYIGQTAWLTAFPDQVGSTFYASIPFGDGFYWFVFVFATAAACVASQAMISAAFSIIKQSISLGCFPQLTVHHVSDKVWR
ncbi:TPA: Potassium transporter, variant 3 [Trebouxia sp. C0004]